MYNSEECLLCVAPDGRLEIWTHERNYMTGKMVWHLSEDANNKAYVELDLSRPPFFWGREVIDSWEEPHEG